MRGGPCLTSHPQAAGALIKKPCVCSPLPGAGGSVGGWLLVVGGARDQTFHGPCRKAALGVDWPWDETAKSPNSGGPASWQNSTLCFSHGRRPCQPSGIQVLRFLRSPIRPLPSGTRAHSSLNAVNRTQRQGGLACCSPGGRKESDTAELLLN